MTPSSRARENSRVIGSCSSGRLIHIIGMTRARVSMSAGGNSPRSTARCIRTRFASIRGPIPARVEASARRLSVLDNINSPVRACSWTCWSSGVSGTNSAMASARKLPVSGRWSKPTSVSLNRAAAASTRPAFVAQRRHTVALAAPVRAATMSIVMPSYPISTSIEIHEPASVGRRQRGRWHRVARRTISVQRRRHILVRRHYLGGGAAGPEAVTQALVALHATDPASVYLSILARSTTSSLADVSAAMYERRSLVRWMAMRRTLFLLPRTDVPIVQAAISTPLAAVLRRRLISQLKRNGAEPPVSGDLETWLSSLQGQVEHALRARGSATGAELAADVPALRTLIPPRAASDRPQNVTSSLLTMMSAQGRIVRGTPTGPWTSRHHRWEPVERWWHDGLPELAAEDSQRELARRWLARFGPATVDDLQWWTGWNKTTVRHALRELPVEDVGLHGDTGIALVDDDLDDATDPPAAALLPALDPTPMGWKLRDWFFGIPQHHVFDNRGNIGPTLWWDGEIIGSWAVDATGEIRTMVVADRGAAARTAIQDVAARMQKRLQGTAITPAIRTALGHSLVRGR